MDASLSPSLRERNRAETRAALVRCALSLFAAEGFDNVPVERICEQASVSRATFFNYFAQKEEVLIEIGRLRLEKLQQFLDAQRAWDQPPTFESLRELFVEFARDNEETARMGRQLMLRALSTPAVAAEMATLVGTMRGKVAAYLESLQRNGRGDPAFDPAVAAENATAIYFWSTLEWTTNPTARPGQLAKAMDRRLEAFFAPLRKRGRRSQARRTKTAGGAR